MTVPSRPTQNFPKGAHLRHPREFERVYQLRCSAREGPLLVFAAPAATDPTAAIGGAVAPAGQPSPRRIGLSVSKRDHGRAVTRNRIKRLLREAFRLTANDWPAGFDWVIVPQRGFQPDLAQLQQILPALARRTAERTRRAPRTPPGSPPPRRGRPARGGRGAARPDPRPASQSGARPQPNLPSPPTSPPTSPDVSGNPPAGSS